MPGPVTEELFTAKADLLIAGIAQLGTRLAELRDRTETLGIRMQQLEVTVAEASEIARRNQNRDEVGLRVRPWLSQTRG